MSWDQLPRENIALYNFPENLFTGTRTHDPVFGKDVFIWKVDFNILQIMSLNSRQEPGRTILQPNPLQTQPHPIANERLSAS